MENLRFAVLLLKLRRRGNEHGERAERSPRHLPDLFGAFRGIPDDSGQEIWAMLESEALYEELHQWIGNRHASGQPIQFDSNLLVSLLECFQHHGAGLVSSAFDACQEIAGGRIGSSMLL